jgi:thioredoxin 1
MIMAETVKQNFNEIIHGERPVLVDFHADWCGPCKMMAPVIEQFSQEMNDKVRILKVDVDRNPRAAASYRIQGVPTFILFKRGNIVWRQSGALPLHALRQAVSPHL